MSRALAVPAGVVGQLVEQKVKRVVVAANNHYQGFSPGTIAALQQRLGQPVSVGPARVSAQLPLDEVT